MDFFTGGSLIIDHGLVFWLGEKLKIYFLFIYF